ncbi:MAG: glycosyltransferase [Thermincola sp.]|jgi:glycosyltransferase involved in cell wall biosynthesis|nr:glycosyltransferase [Thermincola sp.]
MRSIEVLVAAMNQKDAGLYYKLGLKTNAVIGNQTDSYWYQEYSIEGNTVKVVSTKERGVGKNRNTALLHASGDICLIGDEDLIYSPDYREMVGQAFDELPEADIIVFHIVNLKDPKQRQITRIKKVGYFNFARFGACQVAFKKDSVLKANIWFSLLFGGGAKYSSGEDTLFLREALSKGLKIYTYPQKIADAIQETSTWFTGYHEKFFFDKGVLMANSFPKMKYIAGLYIAARFRANSGFSYLKAIKFVFNGINAFKDGVSYEQWKEKAADCE